MNTFHFAHSDDGRKVFDDQASQIFSEQLIVMWRSAQVAM